MSNNNHKSNCENAETLVAYLYDEISGADKSKFEKHLQSCRNCGEEFAAFGTIRNAVGDWREIEFAPLAAPSIVLPATNNQTALESEKVSFVERIRSFLFPNGGFVQGATAFAAFAICALLLGVFGYAMLDRLSRQPIAEIEKPVIEQLAPPEIVRVQTSPTPKPTPVQPSEIVTTKPNNVETTANSTTNPKQRPEPRRISTPERTPKKPAATPKSPNTDLGFEPLDADDDDAPRLSDLFDELPSR